MTKEDILFSGQLQVCITAKQSRVIDVACSLVAYAWDPLSWRHNCGACTSSQSA